MRARVTVWTNTGDELESVKPDELTNVGESIHVYAGPVDGRGEDVFELLVCTPGWLASEVSRTGPMVGRHLLIVEKWDAVRVREKVVELFTQERGDDWAELALRLSRLGFWGFEDNQDKRAD